MKPLVVAIVVGALTVGAFAFYQLGWVVNQRPTEVQPPDKPYVCTPAQAEAGECLPLLK